MKSLLSRWRMHWDHKPSRWHRLRGAGVFAAPPEVSAVAATSGYYLSTLRVPFGLRNTVHAFSYSFGPAHRHEPRLVTSSPTVTTRIRLR
jgi:hypothetical protein